MWQLVSLYALINIGGFFGEMAYRNVTGRGVWNRGGRGGSFQGAEKYVRSDNNLFTVCMYLQSSYLKFYITSSHLHFATQKLKSSHE